MVGKATRGVRALVLPTSPPCPFAYCELLSPPRDGLAPPPGLVIPGSLGAVDDPFEPDVPPDVPELDSLGEVLDEPGAVVLLPELLPEPLG